MKGVREIFRLTSAEQRAVVIVILALLAFAILQKQHRQVTPSLPKQSSAPATTPSAADAD